MVIQKITKIKILSFFYLIIPALIMPFFVFFVIRDHSIPALLYSLIFFVIVIVLMFPIINWKFMSKTRLKYLLLSRLGFILYWICFILIQELFITRSTRLLLLLPTIPLLLLFYYYEKQYKKEEVLIDKPGK